MPVDTVPTPPPQPNDSLVPVAPERGVSGAVFVAIRHFAVARFKSGTLETLCKRLDGEARNALLAGRADAWYPSEHLLAVLRECCEKLSDGDLGRYHALVYDATLHAMRYTFREAMALGDTTQIVSQLPDLWQRLERGDTVVTAGAKQGVAEIRVRRRTGALDPLYLQTVLAMLRALFYAATGVERSISIKRHTKAAIQLWVGGLG